MFKMKAKTGYSNQLFQEIFDNEKTAIVLSPEANIRMKYVDNSPTNEIDSYRYWFVIKGQQPFEVKFSSQQTIEQFDEIEFQGAEACNVRGNIYFRANSVTVLNKGGK
ncbi:hypothetical protein [Streptococcus mitis]|jgi:hypothetical protein|uniref:hypothetical protein n=1 Tax=Streptococcus mitis TaxID=28037 RepID=UPI00398BE53A